MSDGPPPVPSAAQLEALDADTWARLLPELRAALHDVPEATATPALRRLRAAPTGRLAGGRTRRELCRLVASEPTARAAVAERLARADLPADLRARLTEDTAEAGAAPAGGDPDAEERVAAARRRAERDRRRLRESRAERDRLARRAEGAEARAAAAERRAGDLATEVAALRGRLRERDAELAAAADERDRAVARAQRRSEGRLADLEREITVLRRRDQEQRAELERRRSAPVRDETAPPTTPGPSLPPRPVPGRPIGLPETVARDTAEEVDHLLAVTDRLLVDGYNVTLQHRGHLDLAAQRDWLVRRLGVLAAQRRLRPVVVFDGERASGARPPAGVRKVDVRFTPAGITADDELLFAVEALPPDEPVVVVTDDRELAGRLRARDADVVGTRPFLWATPG